MNKIVVFFNIFFIFISSMNTVPSKNEIYYKTIGNGHVLITIHGGPGMNSSYFSPYLDTLAQNYKLVYYDQRGCGKSYVNKDYVATFDKYVNDLEKLRQKNSNKKITLLAHSFGVVIALKYMLKYPGNIKNAVLVSGYARKHPEQYKYFKIPESIVKRINKIKDSNLSQREKSKKISILKTVIYFHKKEFRDYNFIKKLISPIDFKKNIFRDLVYSDDFNNFDARRKLKEKDLNLPVLIIVGKHDIVTPPFLSKELALCFNKSTLKIFKNSAHFPFIEQRQKFIRTVTNFLKNN